MLLFAIAVLFVAVTGSNTFSFREEKHWMMPHQARGHEDSNEVARRDGQGQDSRQTMNALACSEQLRPIRFAKCRNTCAEYGDAGELRHDARRWRVGYLGEQFLLVEPALRLPPLIQVQVLERSSIHIARSLPPTGGGYAHMVLPLLGGGGCDSGDAWSRGRVRPTARSFALEMAISPLALMRILRRRCWLFILLKRRNSHRIMFVKRRIRWR